MNTQELIAHVDRAIKNAHEGVSNLDEETLKIGGFSTPFQRMLINNLCADPVETYLEIGLFRGATFCAAACGNKNVCVVGVEDFSQPFGEQGVKDDFIQNVSICKQKCKDIVWYEQDCWNWNKILNCADVFCYDGEHSLESQSRAIPHFYACLKDSAVIMIDDFSWPDVNQGTRNGFSILQNKMKVMKEWVFHVTKNDDPIFHNGVAIFVVEKI